MPCAGAVVVFDGVMALNTRNASSKLLQGAWVAVSLVGSKVEQPLNTTTTAHWQAAAKIRLSPGMIAYRRQ